MPASLAQREQVARLAKLVEGAVADAPRTESAVFSTGCRGLDRCLPEGGLARGTVIEWLAAGPGAGAGLLALAAAREAQQAWAERGGGAVAIIDRQRDFYPPAAAAWGLDLANTLVVHPASEADERWAIDQALRCEHLAAVVAWPRRLDGRTFRRLQLAAEANGTVGLLVQPWETRRDPSWSHVRWVVRPRPAEAGGWHLAVRLLRLRGASLYRERSGQRMEMVIEIDPTSGAIHETRAGDLVPQLARAATGPSQA
jgi:protein ImuA